MSIFDSQFFSTGHLAHGHDGAHTPSVPDAIRPDQVIQPDPGKGYATLMNEGPNPDQDQNFLVVVAFLDGTVAMSEVDSYDLGAELAAEIAQAASDENAPVIGVMVLQVPDDEPMLWEVRLGQGQG